MSRGKRILILGGGFGGVYTAVHLEKILAREEDIEITLISDHNYLLFTPMLPEVPSSSIEAKHIISPIRAFFRKVKFQNTEVHSIDLEKRIVTTLHCPTCKRLESQFDYLVLTLGSTTNFFGLAGVAENAFPMKTLSDAMTLRNYIIDALEHADLQTDPVARKAMLTFVVAGGGFAGVETAAEIGDFIERVGHYYPNFPAQEVRVVLVHAGSRIMPEISEDLANYALRKLQKKKVEVLLNTKINSATAEFVELADKRRISTKTLIWTAGVAPSPLLATLTCARNKQGQIVVNKHLEIPNHPRVYALADCAEILNPQTGQPYPQTAQHAVREGKVAAENIAASMRGTAKRPFMYKPLGVLVSLGRHSAVAEILGFKFSGFFAWWLWRTIYLFKLPGLERKLRVAMDWTLDLFFPRDIVLLEVFMKKKPSEIPMDDPRMAQKE